MTESFVVAIKASARRTNGAVGRVVNRAGTRHAFGDRVEADQWAADLATRGGATVWIRAANPNDGAPVDAYLVGRLRPIQPRTRRPSRGDQATIPRDWAGEGTPTAVGTARQVEGDAGDGDQAPMDRYDETDDG